MTLSQKPQCIGEFHVIVYSKTKENKILAVDHVSQPAEFYFHQKFIQTYIRSCVCDFQSMCMSGDFTRGYHVKREGRVIDLSCR